MNMNLDTEPKPGRPQSPPLGLLRPKRVGLVLLAIALLAFPLVFRIPFAQHLVIMIFMYATLAQGWNILGGYLGQVSLGNAVFFGVGAYSSTMLLINYGLSPWIGMLVGIVIAILISQVIGYPCFKLAGHYFAIATMALGEIGFTIAVNSKLFGGAIGLWPPLLPDGFINFQFHGSKLPYYYIALGLAATAFTITYFIERSRLGYYFRAIKADLDGARSLGINATLYKSIGIAFTAAFSAAAGTFYAQYVLFVDPESVFNLQISILILLTSILGGVGVLWGPALGVLVLIPLSEATRVLLGGSGKAYDLMIYSALIIVMAIYQPMGLAGLLKKLSLRWQRR